MSYQYEDQDPTGLNKWKNWSSRLLDWCVKKYQNAWDRNETFGKTKFNLSNPSRATHEKQTVRRVANAFWNVISAPFRAGVAILRTAGAFAIGTIGLTGLVVGASLWEGLGKGVLYTLGGLVSGKFKLAGEGIFRISCGGLALFGLGVGAVYYGPALGALTLGGGIVAGMAQNIKQQVQHRYAPGSPPPKQEVSSFAEPKPIAEIGPRQANAMERRFASVHEAVHNSRIAGERLANQGQTQTGSHTQTSSNVGDTMTMHNMQRTENQPASTLEAPPNVKLPAKAQERGIQEILQQNYSTQVTPNSLIGINPIGAMNHLKAMNILTNEAFTLKIKLKSGETNDAAIARVNALLAREQAQNRSTMDSISNVEILDQKGVQQIKISVKDGKIEKPTVAEPSLSETNTPPSSKPRRFS